MQEDSRDISKTEGVQQKCPFCHVQLVYKTFHSHNLYLYCPKCGWEDDRGRKCKHCGYLLHAEDRKCPQCGRKSWYGTGVLAVVLIVFQFMLLLMRLYIASGAWAKDLPQAENILGPKQCLMVDLLVVIYAVELFLHYNCVFGINRIKRRDRLIAKGHYVKAKFIEYNEREYVDDSGKRRELTSTKYEYDVNGKRYSKWFYNKGNDPFIFLYYEQFPKLAFLGEKCHPLDVIEAILCFLVPLVIMSLIFLM